MTAVMYLAKAPQWSTLTFTSTLYLQPVLDKLLAHVPEAYREEVRLGLQEALVNAAKHGNELNPQKVVLVRYSIIDEQIHWVITDQGAGFDPPSAYPILIEDLLPEETSEGGRGLFILYEIFDEVYWNAQGTELSLSKDCHHYLSTLNS
ncbi:anti-sigma regulatory factor [Synechococcus sp. PCC 6312]|uniref:ATP-binding protein n=1 Tax=Synechococcus sp. (strain ATCC 27167 / PCC 6312) TaxID=195253 RepID=UPI00029EDCCE|nr:anti-sigma regulatory factor [Synechococcus sp. PCC 6312]AFY60795.1 anti-sigma regulatory factor (Ser/Thr protein kinase) [Synechococcus sp. PCC 6312]